MKSIREALNRRQNGEAGFTLVEMLVVIVIVGILAAVAIPIYMNQRKKGWISAVESDVKSAAVAISTEVAKNGTAKIGVICDATANGSNPNGHSVPAGDEKVNCSTGVKLTIAAKQNSDYFTVTGERDNLSGTLVYDSEDSTYENKLS
ncbi:MAG: prepilin-type N-terminal cleavage/methylation domain-containing protein [Bifidobacteriaceae bacterium]|nr:prepilin-type N-terminal cleavage/methylation domain-containing protein [Bifidobacteriaceae bacterium]